MNKMNKKIFGIGMILAVLTVLTVPAAAVNTIYMVPSDSNCGVGETTDVTIYLDATDSIGGFQVHLKYEDDVIDIVNITSAVEVPATTDWDLWGPVSWRVGADGHHYLFFGGTKWSGMTGSGLVLAKITLKGLSEGTRPLEFLTAGTDPTELSDPTGEILSVTVINGTFTCGAAPETFSKDLVEGWNLVSLPLTPLVDNSTSAVLSSMSGKYDAVYSYNAATKQFEDVMTGTMDPGIGYFVHVTTAGTWTYTGIPYTDMSVPLEPGLNMVGWLNCSKPIGDALSSITGNYWYVARWNATSQKFETYNPVAPNGFNDFADMERGEGYFISMKGAGTLTAPC
ncbi:hypothetical protein CW713_07345 [Methanophagales archaeon]|nr:MAG: hypothetical protein CW713_07345 [Methanophagales archaeon]